MEGAHSMGKTTHGMSRSRLYRVWNQMIQRCENPNSLNYKNYGKCGIRVCKAWHDFPTFYAWAMKTGYDPDAPRGRCTIDRIDNNKGYNPKNCRWLTIEEQLRHKRYHKPIIPYMDRGTRKPIETWEDLESLLSVMNYR